MCNQLLQISHWIPVSIEHNIPLYFPEFANYRIHFSGTNGTGCPRFPAGATLPGPLSLVLARLCTQSTRVPGIPVRSVFAIAGALGGFATRHWDDSHHPVRPEDALREATGAGCTSLWGHGWGFRDYDALQKHKDAVRAFFSPVEETAERVNCFMEKARTGDPEIVGIHIRRGDYARYAGGRYFYSDDNYRSVMQRMEQLLRPKTVRFLIVSNQGIEADAFSGLDTLKGPGDAQGDLHSLSQCDYIIGPPSTFSMWASFSQDKPLLVLDRCDTSFTLEDFAVCRG